MTIELVGDLLYHDLRRAGQTLDGLMKELGRVRATLPVLETGTRAAYSA